MLRWLCRSSSERTYGPRRPGGWAIVLRRRLRTRETTFTGRPSPQAPSARRTAIAVSLEYDKKIYDYPLGARYAREVIEQILARNPVALVLVRRGDGDRDAR